MILSHPLPREVFTGEHFPFRNMAVYEEQGKLGKQDFCKGKCNLTKHAGLVSENVLPIAQLDPN